MRFYFPSVPPVMVRRASGSDRSASPATDLHSREHAEWSASADRETRQAHGKHYWGHRPEGEQPRLYWDEIEVSEDEFRDNVSREERAILGMD
jgi:hypothetical protein